MAASVPQIRFLVVQPTSFCNIDCQYCYLPDRASRRTLSVDLLVAGLRRLKEAGWLSSDLSLMWHCGEPLVAGIHFFERAFASISEVLGTEFSIKYSIQTNAMLINKRWCELFQNHGVRVGVSLDGPPEAHDRNRRKRNGAGTFDDVMRGVSHLMQSGISFGTISVLDRISVQRPLEFYSFFHGVGIRDVAFSIEESDGINLSGSMREKDYTRSYGLFLRAFWNKCLDSKAVWRVREFDDALRLILRPETSEFVNFQTVPFGYLMIGASGEVTTFSPELLGLRSDVYGHFAIGNLCDEHVEHWLESPVLQHMERDVAAGKEKCRLSCGYYDVCKGGAPANKLGEHGTFDTSETSYCRGKKEVIDLVVESLGAQQASL